jgi:hypothetical protein
LTAVRLLTGKDTQRSRRAHTHTHMCTCAHGGDEGDEGSRLHTKG